jgi:hypothetical protein
MDTQPWSRPVQFQTGIGQSRILVSTEEASHYLRYDWPKFNGPMLIDARRACLDVLAGRGEPDDARSAFVAACKEADIHVIP